MIKAKFSDAFELQMGKTPSRNNPEYWNGNNKWISISDLGNSNKFISETKECISDKGVKESKIKIVPKGTVIMSFKLSIGKTAITAEDMYTNEAIMAFIDKKKYDIDKNYLYYLLSGYNWLDGTNKAVLGLTLNKATLSQKKILIFPIEEQQKIAAVLDKVSDLITLRKKQLEKLEELVKARFVEMFGDPIYNSQHFPTTEFVNVVTLQRGYDLPVYNRNSGGLIPIYGANGILDYHNEAKSRNGVITGRSGTIGKVYYCEGFFWPLNTTLFSIDNHGNNVIYLAYLLQYFNLKRFYDGTGVPTLNRNIIHKKQIINIPIELQEQFANFVTKVDKQKLTIQKSLDKLEILKKALMQEYFG